eukprot:scaffold31252_cov63-Phaeocystis_antarctica.AAC.10
MGTTTTIMLMTDNNLSEGPWEGAAPTRVEVVHNTKHIIDVRMWSAEIEPRARPRRKRQDRARLPGLFGVTLPRIPE